MTDEALGKFLREPPSGAEAEEKKRKLFLHLPYVYVWGGRFTGRKYRTVRGSVLLDKDSRFEAQYVAAWVGALGCAVELNFPTVASSGTVVLQPEVPFFILPRPIFDPGSRLPMVAKLVGTIGRRRPQFRVVLSGDKIYNSRRRRQ